MRLDYNLGDSELRRVFDALDSDGDGRLSIDEFKLGRGDHPFTRTLVETLSGACHLYSADRFRDNNFDCNLSTSEFYRAPLEDGFFGENVDIRKTLDYTYHNNYAKTRQFFQDALIKSNLLLGSGSDKPWYVLTCGPMVSVIIISASLTIFFYCFQYEQITPNIMQGAGKGWILGWMSATGILQLERVSKIDPDAFKLKMPEWQVYQDNNKADLAGSMTHAESSYVAEIAQHVAMKNSMDVWVDGSLRNWQWYEKELQRIRLHHPQYRIAIIVITAPDDMIDSNIKRRAAETGRDIPEELRQGSSIKEIGLGIVKLTYLVDLVASVRNSPPAKGDAVSKPVLNFVSMVDRSGNWDLIRELTSKR